MHLGRVFRVGGEVIQTGPPTMHTDDLKDGPAYRITIRWCSAHVTMLFCLWHEEPSVRVTSLAGTWFEFPSS